MNLANLDAAQLAYLIQYQTTEIERLRAARVKATSAARKRIDADIAKRAAVIAQCKAAL